jgi:hypothetical protein
MEPGVHSQQILAMSVTAREVSSSAALNPSSVGPSRESSLEALPPFFVLAARVTRYL